jgi:hypothetical protein
MTDGATNVQNNLDLNLIYYYLLQRYDINAMKHFTSISQQQLSRQQQEKEEKMIFTTFLLCACAAMSLAASDVQLLGRGAPTGWRALSTTIDANKAIEFRLALTQSAAGKQRLEAETLNRADPDSPLYGQWLTQAEVLNFVAPPLAVTQKVVDWVESQGEL